MKTSLPLRDGGSIFFESRLLLQNENFGELQSHSPYYLWSRLVKQWREERVGKSVVTRNMAFIQAH